MDFDIVFTAVAHPCLTLEKVGQKMTPDLAKIGLEARIIESSWRDFQRLDIGFWAQDENQTEPRWQSLGQISWGENQDGYTPRAKTLEQVLGNDLCSPSLFVFLNQGELAVAKVSFFPYRSSLASYQEFDQEKVPALRYTRTQELLSQFAFFADRLENPQLLKEAVYHLLHKRRNCAWEDSLFVVDGLSLKKTSLKTAEILDLFCQQFDQLIPNQKGKKTAVEEFLNVYENTFNGNPTMAVGCLLKDPGESLAGTSFYGEGYNRFFKRLDNFLKENGLSQDEALHQIARFCNGRFGSQGQRQDQKGFSRFVGYLYQLVDTNIQKLTSLFTPEVKLGDTGFIQDFLLNALPPEFISVTPELLAAEPVWS
jgi:hypothetical protein